MTVANTRGLAAAVSADATSSVRSQATISLTRPRRAGYRVERMLLRLPASTEDVAAIVRWCYESDVPVTPRGGGTGYAGGSVPDGGVLLSFERLSRVRSFEPLRWRARIEAGVRTCHVQRLAPENGLYFPPDPGAAEQSQLGGNVATNAGGPHAFKYGVTGAWVTGVEAVVPPGDVVRFGGPVPRLALVEALADGALMVEGPTDRAEIDALWRWREGVGMAVDGVLGGKVSEDIAVPVDQLAEAIEKTREIGLGHDLATCSWGHAGDGNLHSTFLFARTDLAARDRAQAAAEELFALAQGLGGTISGEHGVGVVKAGRLRGQWGAPATRLHEGVKDLFDPKGLLTPEKKVP